MHSWYEKNRMLCAGLFGAFAGIIAFLLIHTGDSLIVNDDSWIMRGYVERDIIQHYTGWLFYRDSHAGFPLGVARSIGYPYGGAVAFSDSVPLMSVFFGMFSGRLPQPFQFFGIYTLLCYTLMGISAALLLFLFFESSIPVLFGTPLFILSPIMTERAFRHTALASHFLLIFALFLYFSNRKKGFRFRVGYPILFFLAVTIHFYFVPMLCAILFADLLQDFFDTGKWIKHCGFLLLNLSVVFIVAFASGYFYAPTKPSGELAYGYFTMNLNAVFNPGSVSGIHWSRFLPVLGQGLGSAEGFNYLGLGTLLVLISAGVYYVLRFKKLELQQLIRGHRALLIVSVILALFAVSTTIVINNNAYVRISLPMFLLQTLSTFRASGRLFWPCYYLLTLFAVVFLAKKLPKKAAALALAAFLIIQVSDLYPTLKQKREAFIDPKSAFGNPCDDTFFIENTSAFSEVFTFSDSGLPLGLYIANFAVSSGMNTNEPFMARNNIAAYREAGNLEFENLMAGHVDDEKLYLFGDVNRFFDAALSLGDSVYSGRIDFDEGIYYIIAPKNQKTTIPEDSRFQPLHSIPLTIAEYTDSSWTNGILNADMSIALFYDNAFTARFLKDAEYLIAEGQRVKIIDKDYKDAGWVMVKLDLPDAAILVGSSLEAE